MSDDHDFDFEPVPGLPAPLPEGERMIWRGTPDPWHLAARALRMPVVGAYFVALAGWQLATHVHGGASLAQIANAMSWTGALALTTLAILAGLGFIIGKNTVYTLTSRRIIIRHGVAMPIAINIPFAVIDGAEHRTFADDRGNISVSLAKGHGIARLMLWPHTRPGRYLKTEPMLRSVPDSARVAALISDALAAHAGQPAATASLRDHQTTTATRLAPTHGKTQRDRAGSAPAEVHAT